MSSESDAEFVERIAKFDAYPGFDGWRTVSIKNADLARLFDLARRGAEAADRIEQLETALREAADELDAYYRAEYPGGHPYSQKKLTEAMASNPARAALKNK